MRVATIPDPQGAGLLVSQAAIRRGHTVVIDAPDVAYIRTLNYGPWKTICLERIASYHHRGIPTLPTYADSLLYDDKVAQLPALSRWLPKTYVIHNAPGVVVRPEMDLPFISKTASGSASKNVRIIRTQADADAEWKAAFGGEGIYCISAGRKSRQRGYLYWQEFIPGNKHDIRVVVNGDHLYGLRRFNRSEYQPFASGSGNLEPLRDLDDDYVRGCFAMADEISSAIGARWACYDFVRDENGRIYALEFSTSWSEKAYNDCPVFDRRSIVAERMARPWRTTGRTARDWPSFAVDEMERLLR